MQQLFHLYQIYQQILFEIEFYSPIYQQTIILEYKQSKDFPYLTLIIYSLTFVSHL